jgi:hypothetical protein
MLAIAFGIFVGIGGYTFRYAEGLSYFSTDPAACANCHIMQPMDFMVAENSMGFHAPQEAARILGEAIDYARQAEILANRLRQSASAGL